jgi:hypothetical protein
MTRAALDYLQRLYGLPAVHVQSLTVDGAWNDVTLLTVTLIVQTEDLRPHTVEVPLIRPSMFADHPRGEDTQAIDLGRPSDGAGSHAPQTCGYEGCGGVITWDPDEPTRQAPRWRHADQLAVIASGRPHRAAPAQ